MNQNNCSYICADLHLQKDEKSIKLLISLIDSLKDNEELIINGDIFDVFVGDEKFMFPWQKELLSYFKKAKDEGKKIHYIEGNRDFFVDNLKGKYFYSVYKKACYRQKNSILIIHGDKINKRDYLYRVWNFISKNRLTYASVHILPRKFVQALINYLEKKMKPINKKYKEKIPEEEIENFIRSTDSEVQLIISGHFHKYLYKKIDGKEFIAIPSWKDEPNVLKINQKEGYELINLTEYRSRGS